MSDLSLPSAVNQFQQQHVQLLSISFQRFFSRPITLTDAAFGSLAEQLYYDSGALVSHNTARDPVFNYANLMALRLFEMSWEEFIGLPSRLSAEPVNQLERARLLSEVNQKGGIENYKGVRISKSGRRFCIKKAQVWNLVDGQGDQRGQAAYFKRWYYLDKQ
jgi:hypothetical protein